jgi:hypothetical protein
MISGKTLIGSENADIILKNDDIEKEHCYLINDNYNVILYPLNSSKCMVNGESISKGTQLENGSMVIIGNKYFFRYNNPNEIDQLKRLDDHDILLKKKRSFFCIDTKEETIVDVDEINEKFNNEKLNFINQLNDYEIKIIEQKKQIEKLSKQNEWANGEIKLLNNELKIRLSELKEKNEIFESEKIEYLVEKEQFEVCLIITSPNLKKNKLAKLLSVKFLGFDFDNKKVFFVCILGTKTFS